MVGVDHAAALGRLRAAATVAAREQRRELAVVPRVEAAGLAHRARVGVAVIRRRAQEASLRGGGGVVVHRFRRSRRDRRLSQLCAASGVCAAVPRAGRRIARCRIVDVVVLGLRRGVSDGWNRSCRSSVELNVMPVTISADSRREYESWPVVMYQYII